MPEQITQKLGFDASAAITSLTNLNQKLGEFRQGLKATSGGLRKFEANAQTTIITFRELGRAGTAAAAAVAQLRTSATGAVPPQVSAQAAAASAAMSNLGASATNAQTKLAGVGTGAASSAASMSKLATSATAAAASVRKSSATTVAAANKTSAAMTKTGAAGAKAAKTISLSWTTIGRIIGAQVIIRGLSLLVSTFNDAQEAAREFSLRVGEISTISGTALGTIDQISASTLELSRNLGLATDEVAEGLYQTLSNQVVEAGEALRFEETAAKLSITTHSQLKESINALSSVMNSYGLDISEVDEVSAVLFKTIELGRLRMGEFGDVLGRVTPLTAALGIEYKEMAAALAALTQKGVPAHTAITQLTAVTQKLLRPTEKLQELYNEWGVETGPEAIRRFGGLRGVLLKMRDATAGNDKEFADLLGRVRSMVGAMNLTTNEAGSLTEALAAMEDPVDELDAAFDRMESTIGRRSVKAWDDLDVSVHQAGETFLQVTTPMVELLATLARNSDVTLAALAGLGIGALVVSGKLAIAGAALLGFNAKLITLRATMLTILPVAIAIAAAIAAIQLKKAVLDSLDTASELMDKQKNSQESLTKSTEALSKARIEATKEEVRERTALISGFVESEERLLKRSAQLFAIESEAIADVLGDTLTDLENKRVKALKVVKDAVTGMDDAIKDSQQIIKETQEAISELDFQRGTKQLNEQQKVWAGIARTEKKATAAANEYKDALASEEDATGARRLSKIAEAQAKQSVADAERLGNVATITRAEKLLSKILADRLRGEQTFINERKALDTSANRLALKNLEEQGKKLQELLKLRAKLLRPTDDDGVLKDPSQIKADTERADKLKGAIAEALKGATEFDFAKALKIEDLGTELTSQMEDAVRDATFRWDEAVTSLEAQLTAKSYAVNVVLNIDDGAFKAEFEKSFGELNIADPKALDQIRQVSERILAEEEAAIQAIGTSTSATRDSINNLTDALDPSAWTNWLDSITDSQEAGRAQIEGMNKELSRATTAGNIVRQQWSEVSNILSLALKENRAITAEELKKINFVIEYNRELEKSGKLSGNRLAIAKQLNVIAQKGVSALQARAVATAELKKLDDSPEKATENLKKIEDGARKSAAEEKKLRKEVDGVTNGIKASKEAADQIPGAANTGASAISREADEAGRLKTNLQGALSAQQRLSQTRAQVQPVAPVTLQVPELPVAPVQKESEVIKAATESTEPFIQGIENVKEAAESVPNFGIRILNGVTQATSATRTLGAETLDVAGKLATTAGAANSVAESVLKSSGYIAVADTSTDAWASGMDSVAVAANNVTLAMQAAAKASTEAAIAASMVSGPGGNIGTAFHGGPAVNYRAAGGPASRGADTIPVMASPDEFFMNARSSRRFASELQAMNAGREPIFRDKGGSVTNVGDINVSVTQGETANATARQIASSLRRELRRGTSRL